MKQILQDLKDGATEVVDIPAPEVRPGCVLIRSEYSLVSAGTERMLIDFGKANYLQKARQQPDKVRMVIDKVRTDGLASTYQSVQAKLDQPLPLGYSNVGRVVDVGDGVTGLAVGDRVVSNGHHAEYVCVPERLCAVVPEGVSGEAASFTVVAAIALQGIRLVQPTLGENVVVTGLGLIGLITVQLLRASGCNVLGLDTNPERVRLAESMGAQAHVVGEGRDPLARAAAFSGGRGVDAVIITASTRSSEPVHQAAEMSRKRGRIVLVGVTGLELSRADFYEKELSFQVSCSYGPGRYDPSYEEEGHDYPFGFVRWTEQRNFEAVLSMLASQRLNVDPLVEHRYAIDDAAQGYAQLADGAPLGIVLTYPQPAADDAATPPRNVQLGAVSVASSAEPIVDVIGAGNYANQVLLPAFAKTGCQFSTVVSANGLTGTHAAKKFGFAAASTSPEAVIQDSLSNTVVIATRHDSHARFVVEALSKGKHTFVEKPLALNDSELDAIERAYRAANAGDRSALLMVGFNRRFAPQIVKIRELLASRSDALTAVMTVNAGAIPADHWTQHRDIGGGRIIGEACHFIDLLRHLVGAPITRISSAAMGDPAANSPDDKMSITLEFADGSLGTVHYLANGHRSFPKERLEIFCAGSILQLDNFRSLRGFGWPGFRKMNLRRQDKGQNDCAAAFVDAVRDGRQSPIPFEELIEVARATFSAALPSSSPDVL